MRHIYRLYTQAGRHGPIQCLTHTHTHIHQNKTPVIHGSADLNPHVQKYTGTGIRTEERTRYQDINPTEDRSFSQLDFFFISRKELPVMRHIQKVSFKNADVAWAN